MIAALLTLALSAPTSGGAAPQVPVEVAVPAALHAGDVCARVQITATHFAARSLAPFEQWVVFENRAVGLRTARGLAPFGELLYPLARPEDVQDVTIEIVSVGSGGQRAASAPIPCRTFAGTSLFLQRVEQGVEGWVSRHGGRALTRVAAAAPTAPHVPVPVPSEDKRREKARKVEREKLPPL